MGHLWRKEETLEERLVRLGWEVTEKGCWEWRRSRSKRGGYGQLSYRGKLLKAHRAAFLVWRGEIPEGSYICHTCDNPPCINPDHLYAGTPGDNHRDMRERGRSYVPYSGPGEQSPNARLTEEQVREIRELVSEGDLTLKEIGLLYSTSKEHIWAIKERRIWSTTQ